MMTAHCKVLADEILADCSQIRQSAKIISPSKFPAIRYAALQICELLKRYPTNRKEAAKVLTMFKLNMDVAVRDLEQKSLKGIMEFIWEQVDQGEIRQMESDRLEDLVRKKKDTDNDVRQQLRIHGVGITYSIVHAISMIVFCLLYVVLSPPSDG